MISVSKISFQKYTFNGLTLFSRAICVEYVNARREHGGWSRRMSDISGRHFGVCLRGTRCSDGGSSFVCTHVGALHHVPTQTDRLTAHYSETGNMCTNFLNNMCFVGRVWDFSLFCFSFCILCVNYTAKVSALCCLCDMRL